MTQLTIVTTPQNSGDGTPLATAFNYCNSNFSELYARVQTQPPATLVGTTGDAAGMYAYDSNYFYYCFANYTGNSTIWGQVTQVANIAVSAIQSGTSNVKLVGPNGDATVNINGTSNIAAFRSTGAYVIGILSATGNIRGSYILGNGSQLTGLPATYSNANVAAFLPVYSGNLSADIITANTLSTTGNVTGNYILGNGSQLTGLPALYGNSNVSSFLSAFGSNTISSTGNITTTANISVGNIIPTGIVSATGNVNGSNINTLGNVVSQGVVSASGNIITNGYFVGNFAGNITGNLVVNGSNTQILFNTNGNVDAVAGLTYKKDSNVFTVLGTISGQGNVIGGNLITAGQVSATGNITGNYILGNGSQLTGLPATYSNSNVSSFLNAFGSNVISTTGTITSGNITGANLLTGGLISATGNISGGLISATGNILGGNLSVTNIVGTLTTAAQNNITSVGTLSSLTVTANIAGGNLTTGGQVSATGNIKTANYLSVSQDIDVSGNVVATGYTGTSVSVTANVSGGNIRTVGQVTASGNVTGNYILGNISFANGSPSTNTIQNGNSNVLVGSSAGNVSINVNGISPVVIFTPLGQTTTGIISATGTITGGNVNTGGTVSATGTVTGGNVATGGTISGDGTATVGNLSTGGTVSATGTITGGTVSALGTITGGNLSTGGAITGASTSVSGTVNAASVAGGIITGSSLSVSGNVTAAGHVGTIYTNSIINTGSNATGDIGSTSSRFATVYGVTFSGVSTTALYADLAENYLADAEYTPGTVVIFGGAQEITVTDQAADERVAGVVSTNPAYLMNSGEPGLPVALRGKVPVQVVGPVTKGDSLVTSTTAGAAISVGRSREYAQAVFAKALESNDSDGEKVILAVII